MGRCSDFCADTDTLTLPLFLSSSDLTENLDELNEHFNRMEGEECTVDLSTLFVREDLIV